MLSVVIPAYNEAENIKDTVLELKARLADDPTGLAERSEILVIDDHSSDSTYAEVAALKDQGVIGLRLSRRSGSHTALRAGLAQARGDAVLCISADGQDDPAALGDMLRRWRGGAQIVWGLRRDRGDESFAQRLFARWFYGVLQRIADRDAGHATTIDLSRADFYLLDRRVVDALNRCEERNTSLFGLIAWSGFRQDAVDYDRRPRRAGRSKWSFGARLKLAKDWMIAFSGLPLKVMTYFGFVVAAFGLLYALVIFVRALSGTPVEGWASLMIVTLVLGGAQMAMLGVIGEYLWRTLDESRRRALYFIEASTEEEQSPLSRDKPAVVELGR